MDKPLRVDCLAREIPGRAALVVSGRDGAEAAVQLCRDLHEVLESRRYRLMMQTDYFEPKAEPNTFERYEALAARDANGGDANSVTLDARGFRGFRGFPMTSKVGGTCAVCRQPIAIGDAIYHNRELRRAAHKQCGRSSL